MAEVICIRRHGGPEVLTAEDWTTEAPSPDQVLVRQSYCGVNFIDTYYRSGLYQVDMPFVPGQEAVGIIAAVGENVDRFKPGDRVTYFAMAGGGYRAERVVDADLLVALPDWIDDSVAALTMKGMTAQMLVEQVYRVKAGDTVLVHAAAGGVGSLVSQWASFLGARVIGTVGSEEKRAVAVENGCSDVILYNTENFAERVRELTNGALCHAVYDGVGKATVTGSLDSLRPRGIFVNYGNASGPVENLHMLDLFRRGSLYATRPSLAHYASTFEERATVAQAFFDFMKSSGEKTPRITSFPLRDASEAHRELEGRRMTGCLVLETGN